VNRQERLTSSIRCYTCLSVFCTWVFLSLICCCCLFGRNEDERGVICGKWEDTIIRPKLNRVAPSALHTEVSTCACHGDPHCSTFDDLLFNYQGTCKYLFAGVIANRGTLPGFQVYARNDHYFSPSSEVVAYVSYVEVAFDSGDVVRLIRDNTNGKIPVMMLVSEVVSVSIRIVDGRSLPASLAGRTSYTGRRDTPRLKRSR